MSRRYLSDEQKHLLLKLQNNLTKEDSIIMNSILYDLTPPKGKCEIIPGMEKEYDLTHTEKYKPIETRQELLKAQELLRNK